ncbi:MAG: LolA family protein, partial [Candidatus Kapaibacterium sp.]
MKHLVILFILGLLIPFDGNAADIDKGEAYAKLSEKYAAPKTLLVEFRIPDMNARGKLIARRGNKYRLSIAGQTVVSDGETIWNYIAADKNVMISNFEEGEGAFSLEQFFFEIIENFEPTGLYRYTASGKPNSYKLKLEPPRNQPNEQGIRSIDLFFDMNNYTISAIAVY